jgi:hypothetical protein
MESFLIPKRLLFISVTTDGEVEKINTAENVLKLLNNGLSDRNLIKRLFEDQMTKNVPFYSRSDCLGIKYSR